VLVSPGLRFEHITTHFENALDAEVVDDTQHVLLPGVGAIYQPIDMISVFGGVHMGFSPVSPGQKGIEPETAINYELGGRFHTPWFSAEATRFVSDYNNLSGVCTFSSGCTDENLDTQFNAGDARITGVEALAKVEVPTPIDLVIPVTLTYTFTRAHFLRSFESGNPQWGSVQAGDELPYVPMHQAAATVGLLSKEWGGLNFALSYMDGMREIAGSGEPGPGQETDSFVVIDASAQLNIIDELAVYGKVENLLNNDYIVSRRPFGARPGRPRFIYGGVKAHFK
jgi:Fe(3+) dicitrate transport protein